MNPKSLRTAIATLWIALASPAAAMTGAEYFEDGNRLFRDDLYFAALLRYEQAANAGVDTPILHFNTGVAHYRAGQHERAREAFLDVLPAAELRPLAQYNLGLNARAAGNDDEALDWFRLARDQRDDDTISRYAAAAIGQMLPAGDAGDPVVRDVLEREEERHFARLKLDARVSFGTDSNPFRAPGEAYIDYADPAQPIVTPEAQPGAFMPVTLGAKYQVNAYENEGFFGAYRLDGRYYQARELENANRYVHELSFGSEYGRRDEESGRERRLYSAFRMGQHEQVYFDPVDGSERSVNGVDVSDRFSYVRYGPELAYRQFYERFGFGFRGRAELWNYETVEEVPEYDHEYFLVSAYGQYAFSPTSLLRLRASAYSRRFGDRRARDADGSIDIDNDTLRYDYLEAAIVARQRIGGRFWFGVEYERRQREDAFESYGNYARDSYGAEIRWGLGSRFDVALSGHYRLYDFPNAFAFHDPAQGARTLESQDVNVMASYRMTESLSLVFEASVEERVSTDTRIEYQRSQFVLGVQWEPY